MQANISLIFNLSLLALVVYAIFRVLRKQPTTDTFDQNSTGIKDHERDDIIAIRKIPQQEAIISVEKYPADENELKQSKSSGHRKIYFLVPNSKATFNGYDLLQSLLAAKLRFGEGNFFHYYQQQNGVTESIFSVTATTETGEFDLNQMHSFSTRGLCLFIDPKADESEMEEAESIMQKSALRLCQLLDATILDENQNPMSSTVTSTSTETAAST